MDELTEKENKQIFKLDRLPQIPAEIYDWTQMEISIEMNLNILSVNRSYYSLLDCLSDIGGILQVLLSGLAFCLLILNYQHMDNFLAVNLFRIGKEERDDDDRPYPDEHSPTPFDSHAMNGDKFS